jgi:hypothetical protein
MNLPKWAAGLSGSFKKERADWIAQMVERDLRKSN